MEEEGCSGATVGLSGASSVAWKGGGAARVSRVAEVACRQCNKITTCCSSLHHDARPTTKTAPAEKNKFEAGERRESKGVVAQLENRLSY